MLMATQVVAGDIYRMDMRYEGSIPSFPAEIEIDVMEGGQCNHHKGSASVDFDGINMTNNDSDDIVYIDSITTTESTIIINYSVLGYDNHSTPAKFKSKTCYEIEINDNDDSIRMATSCSEPVMLGFPYEGDEGGTFTVLSGEGDCLDDGTDPVECPFDNKLYWIAGDFRIPNPGLGNVSFTIYYKDRFNDPKGTASGYFDGSSLTNIVEDDVARLMSAYVDGSELVIVFEAFGFDRYPGRFKSSTSFEIVVDGGETYRLIKYHTSCSDPINLDDPMDASGGEVTFTNFCGCEESDISNEDVSWGAMKALYR
jgi:hypothetical protein